MPKVNGYCVPPVCVNLTMDWTNAVAKRTGGNEGDLDQSELYRDKLKNGPKRFKLACDGDCKCVGEAQITNAPCGPVEIDTFTDDGTTYVVKAFGITMSGKIGFCIPSDAVQVPAAGAAGAKKKGKKKARAAKRRG